MSFPALIGRRDLVLKLAFDNGLSVGFLKRFGGEHLSLIGLPSVIYDWLTAMNPYPIYSAATALSGGLAQ